MESTIIKATSFGAAALLLFGLHPVKDGVSRVSGGRLRDDLLIATCSAPWSVISGFSSTFVLKSSIAMATGNSSLRHRFFEDGYEDLKNFFHLTIHNPRIARTIFVTRDFNLAKQMMKVKVEVRKLEKQSPEHHLGSLRDGCTDSLQSNYLRLDMQRGLKRINADIISVAQQILGRHALLIESRFRDVD